MAGSVQDGGQVHKRIERAEKLVDGINRRIFRNEFREIVAKGDGYRPVEIGAGMRGFVGDFESVDAGVFDNMVVLAVIDDLHGAPGK